MLNYGDFLKACGLAIHETGPWCRIGTPPISQGWKLHVSSVPVDAEGLLRETVPFLIRRELAFKIVKNQRLLEAMNEGGLGPTQVGKFVTIYPAADVVDIASSLDVLTRRFRGPRVPTDISVGTNVYARYGSFSPLLRRDRLGQTHVQIRGVSGELCDDAYSIPYFGPPDFANPFQEFADRERRRRDIRFSRKVFGPGYVLLAVLKQHAKGAVFKALNVQSQSETGLRVIKQGRQYCMSDRHGREIRWRMRRELEIYRLIGGLPQLPKAYEYFEVDGDGYLAFEHLTTEHFEKLVGDALRRRAWADISADGRLRLLRCLSLLIEATAGLHSAGVVHRDLSPRNVRVEDRGGVRLIDLEMAHIIGDPSPAVGFGTEGFASPQQRRGEAPSTADDVYSIGCLMLLALTGIDPRRLLNAARRDRVRQLSALAGEPIELADYWDPIVRSIDERPDRRPDLGELSRVMALVREKLTNREAGGAVAAPPLFHPRTLLNRAITGVFDATPARDGLWLSRKHDAAGYGDPGETWTLLRSAHAGVAGGVYLAAQLQRFGYLEAAQSSRAERAAQWLVDNHATSDAWMPGLHFGSAGVAVALDAAMAASMIENRLPLRAMVRKLLLRETDWPDVTHGAAGQGIAALRCAPELASRCGQYLVQTQEPDGSWRIPEGFPGLSGHKLTGFAHGAAGIAFFLAEYARRFADEEAEGSWRRAVDWLVEMKNDTGSEPPEWPYSDATPEPWKWWCHGNAGIALALLRISALIRDTHLLSLAERALHIHPDRIRYGNAGYCHGLTGLGEVYLEAFRITQDEKWLRRCDHIVSCLAETAIETEAGGLVWGEDEPSVVTAEFGLGCSGIVHFLLRRSVGAAAMTLPFLI
jgi:serine/threonine protein kinase